MPHEFVGTRVDDLVFGLDLHTLCIKLLQMFARPDMQTQGSQDGEESEDLQDQSPPLWGAKTENRQEDRLQDQHGNDGKNKKRKVPGTARAAGLSFFIVAA